MVYQHHPLSAVNYALSLTHRGTTAEIIEAFEVAMDQCLELGKFEWAEQCRTNAAFAMMGGYQTGTNLNRFPSLIGIVNGIELNA